MSELDGKRQPDVAESDDADVRLLRTDTVEERGGDR